MVDTRTGQPPVAPRMNSPSARHGLSTQGASRAGQAAAMKPSIAENISPARPGPDGRASTGPAGFGRGGKECATGRHRDEPRGANTWAQQNYQSQLRSPFARHQVASAESPPAREIMTAAAPARSSFSSRSITVMTGATGWAVRSGGAADGCARRYQTFTLTAAGRPDIGTHYCMNWTPAMRRTGSMNGRNAMIADERKKSGV